MTNWPLPLTMDRKMIFCTQLVEQLMSGEIRPQYISFETIQCDEPKVKGVHCSAVCHEAILSATDENGVKLYEIDKVYEDTHVASYEDKYFETWL